MRFDRCLSVLIVAGWATLGFSQEFPLSPTPETVQAIKMATAPKIDGVVNAEEWAGVTPISRSLIIGGTNQDSGEKGQVWVAYDDTYIYIAARIYLQNPKKISADEFRDNVSLGGNDNFSFELDTFGTTHDESRIAFNANGATSLDIAGGRANKLEWSGRVEANARPTETGWEGEVRVPWALLPLPAAGTRDMKFEYDWYVSASGRGVTTHTNQGDPTKVHVLAGVEVPSVPRGGRLLLLPYAYLGYDDETGEHITNAGLDFKSAITQEMIAVGTINPDFRNIEGDILSLDFSNFERLANETRPFFQEGNDYLFFGHGRRIFASQRIPTFDMGMNVYGNLGGKSRMGVISTIDFENQATFAGSYTYNPDEITEFTGSFAALQRVGEDNNAGRFAASRRFGSWNVFGEFSGTDDQIEGTGSATSFGAFYDVPGWNADVFYADVTEDFFPRVGFAAETDFRSVSGSVSREVEYTSGPVTSAEYDVSFHDYTRRDGAHYREGVDVGMDFSLANLVAFSVGAEYEHFEDRHDKLVGFEFDYPRNNPYRRFGVGAEFGQIENAWYRSIGGGFRYRPFKRLQLSLRAQTVQHTEKEDQMVFDFNWEMDKYQSIGGRVVYNEHEWNWYASYRMGGNLGAEYFLIVGDPNASSFQKTLVFKVTVPFTIR